MLPRLCYRVTGTLSMPCYKVESSLSPNAHTIHMAYQHKLALVTMFNESAHI